MTEIRTKLLICLGLCCLIFQSCATAPSKGHDPKAYLNFREHMPRSILVLPPQNETVEVMAPFVYLSTITHSLAEKGYYVFPVAVIDVLMKENGVPTPAEMAQIPLKKIKEVINPDAVLYLSIVEWGVKYQLIDTMTIVHIRGRLVDTDTGLELWSGDHTATHSSNVGSFGSIGEALVEAAVEKMAASFYDQTRGLAYQANQQLLNDPQNWFPMGQRHPGFSEE